MKKNSLLHNVAYNMLSQAVATIAPLITAPYVARVFSAELIGAYGYALANSSYFVLVECLGFALYGQIKIAEVRDDKEKRSKIFFEIAILKFILMIVSTTIYFTIYVKNLSGIEHQLACVMVLNIIANGLDTTWFLMGMEEFKFIAIRTTIVRIVNIFLVLLLVKKPSDIILYAMIMQGSTLVSFIVVLPVVFNKTSNKVKSKLQIVYHLKAAAIYFVPGLITTIFSSTDKTMLGTLSGNYEVGVYEQANKISQIGMNAICAIGNALMPRAVYLYHNESEINKADKMFAKSFKIVAITSFPVAFGMAAVATTFVPVFFGTGYEKSALLLPILSANVAIVSFSNLSGQQLLIARKRQGTYNMLVTISAVVNILFNFVMIQISASIGAAFASVISSFIALVCILKYAKLSFSIIELVLGCWKYLCAAVIMFVTVTVFSKISMNQMFLILGEIFVGAVVYVGILLLLREEFILIAISNIRSKLKKCILKMRKDNEIN